MKRSVSCTLLLLMVVVSLVAETQGDRMLMRGKRRIGNFAFSGRMHPSDGMQTMEMVHKHIKGIGLNHPVQKYNPGEEGLGGGKKL